VTKSVEVNFNEILIGELKGSHWEHHWDLIGYNASEPIVDDRDDSRSHTSKRVGSLAMPNPALFPRFLQSLSDKCNRSCKEHTQTHTR